MADVFESTATPPPYGAVNGYGPPDFTPGLSGLIPTPAPIQIRPNAQVQFENDEGFFNNFFTLHSAAFVSTTSFTPNFSFTGETKQIGASIGGSAVWSTGPIPASDGLGNNCFSQVLKIDAQSGTIYFGDIAFYNGANFRNVASWPDTMIGKPNWRTLPSTGCSSSQTNPRSVTCGSSMTSL